MEAVVDKSWPVSIIVKDKNASVEDSPVILGKKTRRKGTYEEYSSSQNESQDNSVKNENENNNNELSKEDDDNNMKLKEDEDNNGIFEISTKPTEEDNDDKDDKLGVDIKYGLEEIKNKIEQKDKLKNEQKEKNTQKGTEDEKNQDSMKIEEKKEPNKDDEDEDAEEESVGENKNEKQNNNKEININEEEIKIDKEYTVIIDIFNYSAQRQCIELKENAPITKHNLLEYLPKKTIISCFSTLLLDTTGKSLEFRQISSEMSLYCKNPKKKIYFLDMDESHYSFTLYNGSIIINKKFFDLMNDKKDNIQFGMCYFLLSIFHEMAFLLAIKLINNLNFLTYYKNRLPFPVM